MGTIQTHITGTIESLIDNAGATHELNAAYVDGHSYDDIAQMVAGGIRFIGVTTSDLDDFSTQLQIDIKVSETETKKVTAVVGDMVEHETSNLEYVVANIPGTGLCWVELGSTKGGAIAGKETSSSTSGVVANMGSAALTGTAHSHTATDAGHTHTYDKATSATFTGKAATSGSATSGVSVKSANLTLGLTDADTTGGTGSITAAFAETPTASDAGHTHSVDLTHTHTWSGSVDTTKLGVSVGDNGHTHTVDISGKTVTITNDTTAVTGGTGKTGITVGVKADADATFAGAAHKHTASYNKASLAYDSTTYSMSLAQTATDISISEVKAGGSITLPSFTATVTDPGHSHTYAKATSAVIAANQSATTSSGKTGVTASLSGTASVTGSVSKYEGNATSGLGKANISLGNLDIEVNDTHQHTYQIVDRGTSSISVTLADAGHTHNITADGAIALGYTSTATGSSKASVTINSASLPDTAKTSNVVLTITDNGHTHTQR